MISTYAASSAADLEAITLEAIEAAQVRVAPHIHRTPLVTSATLSRILGCEVYLKLEMLQKTGSFKVRGAFNKMLALSPGSRVVAVSGGNHGQAVAYAAGQLGFRARVYMPASTPANYVDATRGYGAEVELPEGIHTAFEKAQMDEQAGWVFVHPFDDVDVIAGQGTLGLEIVADLPGVTDVVVSFGGGGMATGVAAAIKGLSPAVRMWGVETEGADCMAQALAAGHLVRLEAITSIARTLGAPSASELTLAAARRWFERVEVVSDTATVEALIFLLERAKVLTEPAAACTWAAAQKLKGRLPPETKLVLVLCGGNFSIADLCRLRH